MNRMNRMTRRRAAYAVSLMILSQILPMAQASAAPCEAVSYTEIKDWQPRQIIATFCADQAETDRLASTLTGGTALRSAADAAQAQMDACEQQMKMLERMLMEKLDRRMPSCTTWH
jgi:hypothetical protein